MVRQVAPVHRLFGRVRGRQLAQDASFAGSPTHVLDEALGYPGASIHSWLADIQSRVEVPARRHGPVGRDSSARLMASSSL